MPYLWHKFHVHRGLQQEYKKQTFLWLVHYIYIYIPTGIKEWALQEGRG